MTILTLPFLFLLFNTVYTGPVAGPDSSKSIIDIITDDLTKLPTPRFTGDEDALKLLESMMDIDSLKPILYNCASTISLMSKPVPPRPSCHQKPSTQKKQQLPYMSASILKPDLTEWSLPSCLCRREKIVATCRVSWTGTQTHEINRHILEPPTKECTELCFSKDKKRTHRPGPEEECYYAVDKSITTEGTYVEDLRVIIDHQDASVISIPPCQNSTSVEKNSCSSYNGSLLVWKDNGVHKKTVCSLLSWKEVIFRLDYEIDEVKKNLNLHGTALSENLMVNLIGLKELNCTFNGKKVFFSQEGLLFSTNLDLEKIIILLSDNVRNSTTEYMSAGIKDLVFDSTNSKIEWAIKNTLNWTEGELLYLYKKQCLLHQSNWDLAMEFSSVFPEISYSLISRDPTTKGTLIGGILWYSPCTNLHNYRVERNQSFDSGFITNIISNEGHHLTADFSTNRVLLPEKVPTVVKGVGFFPINATHLIRIETEDHGLTRRLTLIPQIETFNIHYNIDPAFVSVKTSNILTLNDIKLAGSIDGKLSLLEDRVNKIYQNYGKEGSSGPNTVTDMKSSSIGGTWGDLSWNPFSSYMKYIIILGVIITSVIVIKCTLC